MRTKRAIHKAVSALLDSMPQRMATTRGITAAMKKLGFEREQTLKALADLLAIGTILKVGPGMWQKT